MARVMLLNPPSPAGENVSRGLMGGFGMRVGRQLSYPPIPLAQIASVLEAQGHEVTILDADAVDRLSLDRTVEHVTSWSRDHNPEAATIVALPCSKDGLESELSLCRRLRDAEDLDVHLCLFGPMAQHRKGECFEAGARWVVVGEPEAVLPDLIEAVDAGTCPEAAGIYRVEDGDVLGQGSGRVDDLDRLPIPAFHLLDLSLYGYPDDPRTMTVVHASRGCPIGCPFCAYMVNEGRTIRSRSVDHVMAEIEAAIAHGVELVVFRDPIFTLERRRILDLCSVLETRRWGLEWICETALSCLDAELLAAMSRAGCIGLSFGVESGNAELQRKYAKNKIRSHDHAADVVEQCRVLGIRTRGFFMMGFPEETETMRDETVDLALRLDPDTVQFVPLTLYEGTPLFEDLSVLGDDSAASKLPDVTSSIRSAYGRFYIRPGRLVRELRAPRSLLRKARRYLRLSVAGPSAA